MDTSTIVAVVTLAFIGAAVGGLVRAIVSQYMASWGCEMGPVPASFGSHSDARSLSSPRAGNDQAHAVAELRLQAAPLPSTERPLAPSLLPDTRLAHGMEPISSPAPANWALTMPPSDAGEPAASAVIAAAEVVVSRDGHVASRVAVVNGPGVGSGVTQAVVSGEGNAAASVALQSAPAAEGVPPGTVILRASSQAEIGPGTAGVETGGPLRRTLQAIAGSGQGCTVHSFPASTFTVNVVGCFILGLFTQLSLHLKWPPYVLAAVGTGFCGGLTTMSSYIVDMLKLAYAGNGATAALYWFSTQAACLLAGWIGWLLGDLASR